MGSWGAVTIVPEGKIVQKSTILYDNLPAANLIDTCNSSQFQKQDSHSQQDLSRDAGRYAASPPPVNPGPAGELRASAARVVCYKG